jgi:hypothetical protein
VVATGEAGQFTVMEKPNTSLIIYKDTGVWKDFGGDNQAKPFTALG